MDMNARTSAFVQLGKFLENHLTGNKTAQMEAFHAELDQIISTNFHYNGWFTEGSMEMALKGIASMLHENELLNFAKGAGEGSDKKVAVIMAGNIPAVGFHDLLCVLLSGNRILIKTSSDDHLLIPFFVKLLVHFEPMFKNKIEFAEGKLSSFDAVIATGNNNSAKHFEYYFSKYPHLIRKNRNSAAILTGEETKEDLVALGNDIFSYFGLGCRNVSKLFVPENYDFNNFFNAMFEFREVASNKKYFNNYEYHRALYLLEKIPFLDNNFMMLRESEKLSSPVAVVHYEFYNSTNQLKSKIDELREQLQCLVGKSSEISGIPFGKSQSPRLRDFADGIDTLQFLRKLS